MAETGEGGGIGSLVCAGGCTGEMIGEGGNSAGVAWFD